MTDQDARHTAQGLPDWRVNAIRVAPALPDAPRLLLLGREAPDVRRGWCERFAAQGFEVIAPDLADWSLETPAKIELVARMAVADFGPAVGQRFGVLALEGCAALALALARGGQVDGVVAFAPDDVAALLVGAPLPCPAALHINLAPGAARAALQADADSIGLQLFDAGAGAGFATPGSTAYDRHAAAVAISRTLSVLRPALGSGFDLGRLFRGHLAQEFVHHDADATMATMVAEPYVNHIPTLTGGYGHDMLKRFYKYHFIPSAARSGDRKTVLVSETIGADTVVLEMVVSFVHDEEHEYMLPGLAPTGRRVELPSVVVAKFEGDKLCHEHIYWDQASLLAQIGAMDPAGLPVSGAEQARKVLDPSLPSNAMMPAWARSAGKPI